MTASQQKKLVSERISVYALCLVISALTLGILLCKNVGFVCVRTLYLTGFSKGEALFCAEGF